MGQSNMPKITDAQVEVADGAYWAVLTSHDYQDGPGSMKAMRAALEAYERVRDIERLFARDVELQRVENDARVEESLESLRHKVREGYQR